MATLKKHGEIGQLEYLTYKLAYCEDGKILRNCGNGWKLYKKLIDPAINMTDYYQERLAKRNDKIANNPFYADFKKLFHDTVPFTDRSRVMSAIELLSDGAWSEVNLFRDEYSFDDMQTLCKAYNLLMAEQKEKKLATV